MPPQRELVEPPAPVGPGVARDDDRLDELGAGLVSAAEDRALGDAGVRADGRFDLDRVDLVAGDVEPKAAPALHEDAPVGREAAEVAGVEAAVDEGAGLDVAVVARPVAGARDELAVRFARRGGQRLDAHAVEGAADRLDVARVGQGDHAHLGGAVVVRQGAAARPPPIARQALGQRLARAEEEAHAGRDARARGEQGTIDVGDRLHHGRAPLVGPRDGARRQRAGRHEQRRGARDQARHEDRAERVAVVRRRRAEHAVVGAVAGRAGEGARIL